MPGTRPAAKSRGTSADKSSGRLFLLDTTILIYILTGAPESVARKIDRLKPDDRLGMSWVTWAELLLGALRSNRTEQVKAQLEAIRQVIPVLLPESSLICSYHAEHAARLRAAGTPIGGNDLVDCGACAGPGRHAGHPQSEGISTHSRLEPRRLGA